MDHYGGMHGQYNPYNLPYRMHPVRRDTPSQPQAGVGAAPFSTGLPPNTAHPALIGKTAIAWIVVVAVIVVSATAITSWLLCGCCRSKRTRDEGRRVLDDRNKYPAWNPNAPPLSPYPREQGDLELQPLSKAAVKPARRDTGQTVDDGFESVMGVHPGSPVIVDAAAPEPRYGSPAIGAPVGARRTRYYGKTTSPTSASGGVWRAWSQRFSQIGKAY